ncbi:hypothetical protein BD779DRAFT_1679656 [Infundibulicybe gibba]|nr:hypothetical protein BD779DRAFT_1679656 [Infundibulicybe gibba]
MLPTYLGLIQLATSKIFRATCRQINLALAPQLLSHIVIDITRERIDVGISQLEALATGSTSAGEYAHTVDIRCLLPQLSRGVSSGDSYYRTVGGSSFGVPDRFKVNWARARVVELLPTAFGALKGAKTLIWNINGGDSEGALSLVFGFLLPSPAVTESSGISTLQPGRALNLTKLMVRHYLDERWIAKIIGASPNLTHLDLWSSHGDVDKHTPTLHGVLSGVPHDRPLRLQHLGVSGYCVRLCQEVLPHLRLLESLELRAVPRIDDGERSEYTEEELAKSDRFSSSMGDIWKAFEQEAIHIRSVAAPVDDSLLGYLETTNDIERLALLGADIDALAQRFFTHILPRYAKTLVSLDILASYEGLWCFGTHNISVLHQCTKLVELSVSVNAYGPASVANTVTQIINMTAALPNLCQLGLLSARQGGLRGIYYCGMANMLHLRTTRLELCRSVAAFSPVDAAIHPPVITVVGDPTRWFCVSHCEDGSIKYVEQT